MIWGYSIKKEFWHKGICAEACQAVIDMLKQINIPISQLRTM